MSEAVREGFLCPVCLQDLGDVGELQRHVQRFHSADSSVSVTGLGQELRGIFDKAKTRLRGLDSLLTFGDAEEGPEGSPAPAAASPARFRRGPQEPGSTRSHTEGFKKLRDARADQAVLETNTLIIRLDKLISSSPADPGKKRGFEKGVAPWMSDSESKLCTVCLGRFNPVSRRKHHCRLCGKLTCADCSHFLTFLAARKLTDPALAATGGDGDAASQGASAKASEGGSAGGSGSGGSPAQRKAERILKASLSLLKRDGSEHSLGSLLGGEGEDELRICGRCHVLLRRREDAVERRCEVPTLCLLYDRLRSLTGQLSALYPSHARIAASLQQGESLYSLADAARARASIHQLQESIDQLSRKILHYGQEASDPSAAPSPSQALLQRNIRLFTATFLQDVVMSLAEVPSEAEYAAAQAAHRERVQARIAAERESLSQQPLRRSPAPSEESPSRSGPRGLTSAREEGGWSAAPVTLNPFAEEEEQIDPLHQQLHIIKGFLRQALEAGRSDEAEALERNLRELQAELDKA